MKISKKIIDILKSGNFTLVYHDNQSCILYKGKHTYNDLTDKDGDPIVKEEAVFEGWSYDGYIPLEVAALVKALGGKVDSI